MVDRPIIFSGPMVNALLAGRKTQTRRVLKPPYGTFEFLGNGQWRPICTKAFPGNRLWVREAWSGEHEFRDVPPSRRQSVATPGGPILRESVWFWADGAPSFGDWERPRPSIHMPRWASRLTLTVTEVRVQRLQEISEADAAAEGCEATGWRPTYGNPDNAGFEESIPAKDAFADLWNSLHGPGAWEANPWVAAYTFTVQRGNIDRLQGDPQ